MCKRTILFSVYFWSLSQAVLADGAIEINQSCIDMGCFEADSPGFPIDIALPGVYRLTSDLSLGSGQVAFMVETSDVMVDLNGFTIKGSYFCDGTLPLCSLESGETGFQFNNGLVNITIRNGRFNGMGLGAIDGSNVQNLKLQDLEIINSQSGFSFSSSGNGIIERVQVSRVKNRGGVVGAGFHVRDSLFINNGQQGLLGGYCSRNIFRDNGDIDGSPEQACDVLMDTNYCNNLPC